MPNRGHSPWDTRSYEQGTNSALDSELLGKSDGEFLASRNLRNNGQDGSFGQLKTIFGEELLYPHADNSYDLYYTRTTQDFRNTSWQCMAEAYVIIDGVKTIVELWADTAATGKVDPFIRVGGVIVAASPTLPIKVEYPIQIDTNLSQDGSEIFFTNNFDTPIYLDIYDLLRNSGITADGSTLTPTHKYFDDFNLDEHSVQLKTYNHHPVFIALTSNTSYPDASIFVPPSPAKPGLNVGQYLYRVRYVNTSGDQTALSIPTPMIPVLFENGPSELTYPGIDKYGAAPATHSNLGIILKVRVENRAGFEYLEVTRTAYANDEALGTTPAIETIVGKVSIGNGEISVKTIVDFGGDEGTVTTEISAETPKAIETAKSIRYFQGRLHLMNVKYVEGDVSGQDFSGVSTIPILKSIGIFGHSDPWQHTYYKNYMGGERYGFAVVFFDGSFSRSLAVGIPDAQSFQMPDRRDAVDPLNLPYCYDGVPEGTDSGNLATDSKVYERLSHANAKTKEDDHINRSLYDSDYKILTPTGQESEFKNGISHLINKQVEIDELSYESYNPKAFQKTYFSLGAAIKGIDQSIIPDWATGFTVVRTVKAGRVLTQGLGFYYLTGADSKSLDTVCFYSPELDSINALVNPDNIIPTTHKAEIVAPYAYFEECYIGNPNDTSSYTTNYTDICVYANVIKDDGTINIDGETDAITFDRWRNDGSKSPVTAKSMLGITSINLYTGIDLATQRPGGTKSEFYLLKLDDPIYANDTVTTPWYIDTSVRNFQEPLYLINIVNDAAIVPDANVTNFYDTGTLVKLKSCIGKFESGKTKYALVDERWEDCMPPTTNGTGKTDWFIYVGANRNAWICDNDRVDVTAISDAIALDGFAVVGGKNVYGLYRGYVEDMPVLDTNTRTDAKQYSVNFIYGLPAEEDEIWIHYDSEMPVSVFGGDSYVGDSIFCPIDKTMGSSPIFTGLDLFEFKCGFPYNGFTMGDNYNIMATTQGGVATASGATVRQNSIRQLVCTFVSESRIQQMLSYEVPTILESGVSKYPSYDKYFPRTHYIMRPFVFGANIGDFVSDGGNISNQYGYDYPYEYRIFYYGGFRYRPQNNLDYYKESNIILYPSKPKVGYTDRSRFRTRVIYSLERIPNVQGAPSIRTFLSRNYKDIADNTGEIKYGFDALSGRGNNIYAITDNGICLLLIGKNILSQSDGTELATMIGTQGTYIGGEIWLSNTVGMPKEMWRSATETDNMLIFANLDSVFAFDGEKPEDIGRKMYHNRLYGTYLKNCSGNYDQYITAGFDTLHKEYWLGINGKVLAFDFITQHWNDVYDYNFDKFVSFDNRTFGVGNRTPKSIGHAQVYEMIAGSDFIGHAKIQNVIVNVCAPEKHYPETAIPGIAVKEFERIKIASNVKPDEVNFYDYYGQAVQATLSESIQGEYYLKNYGNFEGDIPRRLASADPDRKRMQGKKIVYEIKFLGKGFQVFQTSIQFREIK